MGYGAPSPINTPGNVQKYGAESWLHTTDVIQGEAEAYQSPYTFNNCRIRKYDFEGSPTVPIMPAEGYGLLGGLAFYVYGTSVIERDNTLCISISATFPKGSEVTGGVKVLCNGSIYSECMFEKNPRGYIYEYGAAKPIGEARVDLPLEGSYKVVVVVSNIVSDSGRAVINYETELPYSKS